MIRPQDPDSLLVIVPAFFIDLVLHEADPDPKHWNCTAGVAPAGNGAGTAVFGMTEPMIMLPPPSGP